MVPILCYPQTKSCQNIVVFIYFNSHLPYANYAIFTADRFPGSVPFAVRFGSCWYYGSDLLRFMSVRFVRFDSVHGDTATVCVLSLQSGPWNFAKWAAVVGFCLDSKVPRWRLQAVSMGLNKVGTQQHHTWSSSLWNHSHRDHRYS